MGDKQLTSVIETDANSTNDVDSLVSRLESLSFLSQYLRPLTFIPFSLLHATCESLLALNASTLLIQISLFSSNFNKIHLRNESRGQGRPAPETRPFLQ